MLDVESADAFVDLAAQGNTIFRQKPNHIMIHPAVFFIADGAATVRSKELAIAIVDNFRVDPDEDDKEEIEKKKTEAKDMELLLAFLWASEHGGLTETQLLDIEESPTLNQLIRNAKGKLHEVPTEANPPEGRRGGRGSG